MSPDGKYLLVEKEINCGALDPYTVMLTVRSQQPRLNLPLFGFPQKEVFAANITLQKTAITWIDNKNIEVSCTGCEKYGIATRVKKWRDLTFHYSVGKAQKGVL